MLDYTLFGESHGPVVGVLLRHVPAGVPIDELQMERDLLRRRPSGALATARQEPDEVQFLSGVFQGRTTGMPLVMALPNRDARPQDYEALRSVARPGHADYTARIKAKGFQDYRGGGHFSGRLTAHRAHTDHHHAPFRQYPTSCVLSRLSQQHAHTTPDMPPSPQLVSFWMG